MTFLKLWGRAVTVPFGIAGGYGNKCAMAPWQLSGLFCTLCKGTLPIVRSALHVVQRHLANCQKHIARCAKAPWQLSEAHCTLCKGTLTIVRSALQIATDVFIVRWIKKLNVAAIGKVLTLGQKIISLKLIWIPALRSGNQRFIDTKWDNGACGSYHKGGGPSFPRRRESTAAACLISPQVLHPVARRGISVLNVLVVKFTIHLR